MTTQERRDQTANKLLEAATGQFQQHGYAGIGVAGIAKTAGVTTGAFYDHFGSKSGAFIAALTSALGQTLANIEQFQSTYGDGWLAAFAEHYLEKEHRDSDQYVCALTSLSLDASRSEPGTRTLYEQKLTEIATRVGERLGVDDPDLQAAAAWRFLSLLVGGLTLARAVNSDAQADIIASAIKAAMPAAE